MIVVDTSIWVRYFRSPQSAEGQELGGLLERREVLMTGVVLAEVIQGVREPEAAAALATYLQRLPYVEADKETWTRAGELAYRLRRQGRAIPLTDLVVAAIALKHDHQLYAVDEHFQRVPDLKLYHGALHRG